MGVRELTSKLTKRKKHVSQERANRDPRYEYLYLHLDHGAVPFL